MFSLIWLNEKGPGGVQASLVRHKRDKWPRDYGPGLLLKTSFSHFRRYRSNIFSYPWGWEGVGVDSNHPRLRSVAHEAVQHCNVLSVQSDDRYRAQQYWSFIEQLFATLDVTTDELRTVCAMLAAIYHLGIANAHLGTSLLLSSSFFLSKPYIQFSIFIICTKFFSQ